MKRCIICNRPHDGSYIDPRYCCKRCKLEDYDGDNDAVEKDNVTQSKIRNYAVVGVLGIGALMVFIAAIRGLVAKLFGS